MPHQKHSRPFSSCQTLHNVSFLLLSDGNQIKTESIDIVRYETAAAPSQNFLQGMRVLSILFLSVKRLEITAEGLVRLRLGSRRNTEICNDFVFNLSCMISVSSYLGLFFCGKWLKTLDICSLLNPVQLPD